MNYISGIYHHHIHLFRATCRKCAANVQLEMLIICPVLRTFIFHLQFFLGLFGKTKKWEAFTRLPSPITVREALSRYLDITSVPSPQFIQFLATMVSCAPGGDSHIKVMGSGGDLRNFELNPKRYQNSVLWAWSEQCFYPREVPNQLTDIYLLSSFGSIP